MTFTTRAAVVIIPLTIAGSLYGTHLGLFSTITVTEAPAGPFTFVYREMQGTSMTQVGEITTALDTLLSQHGLSARLPLDAFFPDGRAEIGFAVSGATAESLAALADVKQRHMPAGPALVASFPRRNRLSFLVGAMKIDSAFAAYRASHGYAKREAYALNQGDTIRYFQWITPVPR